MENWRDIDGFAVSTNMPDLRDLPLDRFCNFVWYWATRNAETQADVSRFEARLWIPPKGIEAVAGPWSPESENAALRGLKASLGQ